MTVHAYIAGPGSGRPARRRSMTQDANEFEEVFGQLLEKGETTDQPAEPVEDTDDVAPGADESDAGFEQGDEGDESAVDHHEPAPEGDQPDTGDSDTSAGDDRSPSEDSSREDLEELKKRAHGYDSMLGRLEQERARARALEQQLAALQQQRPTHSMDEGSAPAGEVADLPEEIREDVEAFQKNYPGYARMIADGGETGKSLRHLLTDYGPEVAAIQARSLELESKLTGSLESIQQQTARAQALSHQERILSDNTDLAEVATIDANGQLSPLPDRELQFQEFFTGLNEWVATRPYAEATRWLEYQQNGTPAQVGELLRNYRTYRTSAHDPTSQAASPARADKARAAGTVPSRSPSVPTKDPDPDDFEGNFGPLIGL
jgi:hypothetical protein